MIALAAVTMRWWILSRGRWTKNRITHLVFNRTDFGFFRSMHQRNLWETALEVRESRRDGSFSRIIPSRLWNGSKPCAGNQANVAGGLHAYITVELLTKHSCNNELYTR